MLSGDDGFRVWWSAYDARDPSLSEALRWVSSMSTTAACRSVVHTLSEAVSTT